MTGTPMDRFDQIDQRLDRLESAFTEYRQETNASIQNLQNLVGELSDIARIHQGALRQSAASFNEFAQRFERFIEQSEADRALFRQETQRIWEYLMRQYPNGGS